METVTEIHTIIITADIHQF